MKAGTICCCCISKRMTRGIAGSLYGQITTAKLTVCEVGVHVYFREKYHNSRKYAHLLGTT